MLFDSRQPVESRNFFRWDNYNSRFHIQFYPLTLLHGVKKRIGEGLRMVDAFFSNANCVVVGAAMTAKHDLDYLEAVFLSHARAIPAE